MRVRYKDIDHRIRSLSSQFNGERMAPRLYTEKHEFCTNNAIYAIEHWNRLAENSNEAYDKALDIYAELCEHASPSVIGTLGSFLVTEASKVRDASSLANSIKHKNSRLKTKIQTKINNKIDDAKNAIGGAIASITDNLTKNGVATQTPSSATAEKIEEFCKDLEEKVSIMQECDRLISNYAMVSNRFNFDRMVNETQYTSELYTLAMEMSQCIDTYQMPFLNKYCFALENVLFAFKKNHMNYPSEKIVEAVTDYFILFGEITESDIPAIQKVKNISVLYEQSDFAPIDFLFEQEKEEPTAECCVDDYGVDFSALTEADLGKTIKDKLSSFKKDAKSAAKQLEKDAKEGNPDEHKDEDVKKMVDDFRKQCLKNEDNAANISSLRALVNKIFTKTPYQIVYELPTIFSIIRASFVIAATAISPILGIVTLITNSIIKLSLSRKQCEKICNAYQKEAEAVKSKIEKTKDEHTKKNLEKYLEELQNDYSKIKQYEDNLYSDDENMERDSSSSLTDDDSSDFDDDWDFDDDEWDFDEAAHIVLASDLMSSICEGLVDTSLEDVVLNNLFKLDDDALDTITDFSITVPAILDKGALQDAYKRERETLRSLSCPSVDDYIRIDCLNDNIRKLESSVTPYKVTNDITGVMCYLSCLNEIVKMNSSDSYVMEMNFTNTLKLAMDRLKKTAVKLSDKEKKYSNSIDVAVNNISKGMEDALMNDNRESIIKGRILPSASKCIKLALVIGAAWAIQPAIAIIGAIGAFACSQKLKAKERQLVLDDIDVELKMCERYIRQAEERNDLKKVKQYEIIQRNLQRQRQRIAYRMKVVYNQNVPNVAKED